MTSSPSPDSDLRIGIDLGGTKIEAVALDSSGEILMRPRVPTPKDDYVSTLEAIVRLVRGIESSLAMKGTVGLGVPGAVSPMTGRIKNANSLWLNGRQIDRDLKGMLGRPVRVANDANCLAISEATDGAASGNAMVFAAILGTGVGGGLAIDGRVHTGRNAIAGEWGHTPLPHPTPEEYPGPKCFCGQYGCIEKWLCGPAAEAEFERLSGQRLSMTEIADSAARGERDATEYLRLYAGRLARALSVIVTILDPDIVVLGGGVSNVDFLYKAVAAQLPRWCFSDAIDTPIVKSLHGDSSGVRGAAWLWAR